MKNQTNNESIMVLQVNGGGMFRNAVYDDLLCRGKIKNNPHRFVETSMAVLDNSMFLDGLRATGKLKEVEVDGKYFSPDFISVKYDYGIELPDVEEELRVSTGKNSYYEVPIKEEYRKAQTRKQKEEEKKGSTRKVGLPIRADEIREYQYTNNIYIKKEAIGITKKGLARELVSKEDREYDDKYIKYVRLYRSAGQAKQGAVIYIRDGLWKIANDWLHNGLKMPKKDVRLVELEAYIPLTCSTKKGEVSIKPHEILILSDITTEIMKKAKVVKTDDNGDVYVENKYDHKVKSTIFDGQALMESSVMDTAIGLDGKPFNQGHKFGFILLRHFYFKAAAFRAHIQKYLRAYAEENNIDYDTWTVTDYFGNTIYMKDVKMITTENATKFIKFDDPKYNYNYSTWAKSVSEIPFGIVKCDHETKFYKGLEPTEDGGMRKVCYNQLSYQMVNTLIMPDGKAMSPDVLMKDTVRFINTMKSNNDYFIEVDKNLTGKSYLTALYKKNPEVVGSSDLFVEYRKTQLKNIIKNFTKGKVLISNADYCTIVGNPMAMLMYAAGGKEFALTDNTLKSDSGYIGCYCKLFDADKELAAFRSPHCSINNCLALKNVDSERASKLEEYFPFSDNIIAVDLIETDFQETASGSDQDSDTILTTDYTPVVKSCQYSYTTFECIVNGIEPQKVTYDNTPADYARMDNSIQKSKCSTGQSSNNAGLATTKYFVTGDAKYLDVAVMCSVLSQVSIDGAKKCFNVKLNAQLNKISKKYELKENKPLYYDYIQQITEDRKEAKKQEDVDKNLRRRIQKEKVMEWRLNNPGVEKTYGEILTLVKEETSTAVKEEKKAIKEMLEEACDRYIEEMNEEEYTQSIIEQDKSTSIESSPMEKLFQSLNRGEFDYGKQTNHKVKLNNYLAKVDINVEGKVDSRPNCKKKGKVERFDEVVAELDNTIKRHLAAISRDRNEEVNRNCAMITYTRQMAEEKLKHRIRTMNRPTMRKIIENILSGDYENSRQTALRTLYSYDPQMFIDCFDFEKK